ncbi:MAG: T9SS type A sorting domain-containing protein [Chitinophagales bacterium]|nr:T9SS type A sorting domain-containing protein [Chitinophagales bacterium]
MNVCIRNTFISLWLLLGASSLSAQGVSFYFPHINDATPGTNRLMPLRVVNFDSVVALQLVIRWNPAVLKYVNIDQFNLPGLAGADFNANNALDSGYVRLQWEGPTTLPPGIAVPDSSTIFRFRFNVIGQDTSSSPVWITELLNFPITNLEVVKVQPDTSNVAYGVDDCTITHGFVAVGFTVSANEPQANELPVTLAPNPFLVSSQLSYFLEETSDVQLVISDVNGKIVHKEQFFQLQSGQHGMVIEKESLGAPGIYALSLRAGRKIATRTLVVLE